MASISAPQWRSQAPPPAPNMGMASIRPLSSLTIAPLERPAWQVDPSPAGYRPSPAEAAEGPPLARAEATQAKPEVTEETRAEAAGEAMPKGGRSSNARGIGRTSVSGARPRPPHLLYEAFSKDRTVGGAVGYRVALGSGRRFVFLTDGGHIDKSSASTNCCGGRCKLIIAIDGEADPRFRFGIAGPGRALRANRSERDHPDELGADRDTKPGRSADEIKNGKLKEEPGPHVAPWIDQAILRSNRAAIAKTGAIIYIKASPERRRKPTM